MPRLLNVFLGVAAAAACASAASAWSAHGHRTITYLALDGLPSDAPAWLREKAVRDMIAEQSNEADRWRGLRSDTLKHENDPDHYLDIDLLPQFGLSVDTVPPLRREYLRAMAIAKHVHPEQVEPYDAEKDRARANEWPGFLPHSITEHYDKLRSSLQTYRTLEAINDPERAHQLELAKQNVIHEMGMLSHFVGDAAQPLHTTKHHHGWVGENPAGYSKDYGFHSYIDSAIVDLHGLNYDNLRSAMKFDRAVKADGPWGDALEHIKKSNCLVEPLYVMEKDGNLRKDAGKALISERLVDGAEVLAALYKAAWESSAPTEQDILAFMKFNNFDATLLPGDATPAPVAPAPGGK